MWVTYVVSRFLHWICTVVDVIRNHLWVLETRRFRRKTAQLMQLMIFISAITSVPACPDSNLLGKLFINTLFSFGKYFYNQGRIFLGFSPQTYLDSPCGDRLLWGGRRTWGWEGGRFIFDLQLGLFPAVWFQIGYLTSLNLESLIWKTGPLFPSRSIMKLDIEKHLVK